MKIKHPKKTYEYDYKPVLIREKTHQMMKEIQFRTDDKLYQIVDKAIKSYHKRIVK